MTTLSGELTKIRIGDRTEEVDVLQHRLVTAGFLDGIGPVEHVEVEGDTRTLLAAGGQLDEATSLAIAAYQTFHHLDASGLIDESTLELLNRPRCGCPDRPDRFSLLSPSAQTSKWPSTRLSHRITNNTGDLNAGQVQAAIGDALQLWNDVSPFTFSRVTSGGDILLSFQTGNHGDGAANAFDGTGGVLAHAYGPGTSSLAGDVHFDDDETWSVVRPTPSGSRDLVHTAAHELGHSLGLSHSTMSNSMMYSFYTGIRVLNWEDRERIRALYGARATAPVQVPGWFGSQDQGGDIAIGNINRNGTPDLVVMHIDNPSGENHAYYRVGWNLNASGNVTGGWTPPIQIPGWFGSQNQGGGVAIADINGNGRPDLIVFHIDNPSGENRGYYRIGWNLGTNGRVTGGWTAPIPVPGWFGSQNQGGSIAVGNVNGSGGADLVVFHLDNPSGENRGYYRVGWNLNSSGTVTGGWTNPTPIPGWFGSENQGGGVALANVTGLGRTDLIVFHLDNPSGENHGYYRVGRNLNSSGQIRNGWGSPILIDGWFGSQNQGGGIATADLNRSGIADLLVFHVDNPSGENHGYHRMVRDL